MTAADVGSNIVSKIPCDDDAVWDEYIINFDVQQHTDCAFHNDRALYASGCVPVSQVRVVDPDRAPLKEILGGQYTYREGEGKCFCGWALI